MSNLQKKLDRIFHIVLFGLILVVCILCDPILPIPVFFVSVFSFVTGFLYIRDGKKSINIWDGAFLLITFLLIIVYIGLLCTIFLNPVSLGMAIFYFVYSYLAGLVTAFSIT